MITGFQEVSRRHESDLKKIAQNTMVGRLYARKLSMQERFSLKWLSEMVYAYTVAGCIWYDPKIGRKIPKTNNPNQIITISFSQVPGKYKKNVNDFLEECGSKIDEISPYGMNVQTTLGNATWLANIRKLLH